MHLYPEFFEDLNHVHPRLREKLVNKARNENVDKHFVGSKIKNQKYVFSAFLPCQ
jgi:hypothetical protein